MKILALQGSPRKNGNTAALLDDFLRGIEGSGKHGVSRFNLANMNIKSCSACDSCKKTNTFCVVNDDMQTLYNEFLEADMLVFATPIYWWSISSQLKLFIDRLYGLNFEDYPDRFAGKRIVLILTYGGEDPNSGADLVIHMFKEIAEYTTMKIEAVIRYCSADKHIKECPEKIEEAYNIGLKI